MIRKIKMRQESCAVVLRVLGRVLVLAYDTNIKQALHFRSGDRKLG